MGFFIWIIDEFKEFGDGGDVVIMNLYMMGKLVSV